jgi:hypothetical protein
MVEDSLAAISVARKEVAADDHLGYLGLSMGTRFGLPLTAQLGDQLTCAVLGMFGLTQSGVLNPGLHDEMRRRDAARIVASTMWHVQRDDRIVPRPGQLELFGFSAATRSASLLSQAPTPRLCQRPSIIGRPSSCAD